MINDYQPLPNQTGANNFRGLTSTEDTQNQFITRVDHYRLLRTLEASFGLGGLGHAAQRSPITTIWK